MEQVLGLCDEVHTGRRPDAHHRHRYVPWPLATRKSDLQKHSPARSCLFGLECSLTKLRRGLLLAAGSGSDTGLGAAPGLDRTGLWRIHNTGPLDKSFNWGDSDDNGADEFLVDFFGAQSFVWKAFFLEQLNSISIDS
jgi:hypothetical protein